MISASQPFNDRWNKRNSKSINFHEIAFYEKICPHKDVHRWRNKHWLAVVPYSHNACQQVVMQSLDDLHFVTFSCVNLLPSPIPMHGEDQTCSGEIFSKLVLRCAPHRCNKWARSEERLLWTSYGPFGQRLWERKKLWPTKKWTKEGNGSMVFELSCITPRYFTRHP